MYGLLKMVWGRPAHIRVALSAAAGIALGISLPLSSIWYCLLLAVLIFRTHIPSVLVSWLAGCILSLIISPLYEPLGRLIFGLHEQAWCSILSLPVLCCLDINQAGVLGSAVLASLGGTGVLVVLTASSLGQRLKLSV
jgi:hypothetical protein